MNTAKPNIKSKSKISKTKIQDSNNAYFIKGIISDELKPVNSEIAELRKDMNTEITGLRKDMNKEFKAIRKDMTDGAQNLRMELKSDFNTYFTNIRWTIGVCFIALGILISVYKFFI